MVVEVEQDRVAAATGGYLLLMIAARHDVYLVTVSSYTEALRLL